MLSALIIYYFFSFSMPENSLKVALDEMSRVQSVKISGMLNGFDQEAIEFLKKNIKTNEITIDPREFQKYKIKRVPVYVLVIGDRYYTVSGDITPKEALSIFYKHTKRQELQKAIKEIGDAYR